MVATFLMLVGFSAAIKVFVVFDCRCASIRLRVDGCRSLRRASIALAGSICVFSLNFGSLTQLRMNLSCSDVQSLQMGTVRGNRLEAGSGAT